MPLVQLAFILFIHSIRSSAQSCDNILNATSCTFLDESGSVVSIATDGPSCSRFSKHCCGDGRICYNKLFKGIAQITGNPDEEDQNYLSNFFNKLETNTSSNNSSRRSLSIPCLGPQTFPTSCKIARDEPYVQDPPVDIPYCLRLPCSVDKEKQTELDQDRLKCGVQPGCYFDAELFQFRKQLSSSVLAGVPVCHFAIRKPVFQEKSELVVRKYGFWNPYFTNCLLKTFEKDLAIDSPGCNVIPALLTFKFAPKLKGWEGITSKGCQFIDGCWRPGEGCFEPVNPNQVTVKSAQEILPNPFGVRHGRPKCQNFNSENSYEVIKSYHHCLSAGCSVDMTIIDFYPAHLFNIGYQMSINDHKGYWKDVTLGRISSLDDLQSMSWARNASKPTKADPNEGKCGGRFSRPCSLLPPPPLFGYQSCPYNPPVAVKNLKPLKGSFKGCCNIDICYIPKKDIKTSYSGPSTYYTGWSFFSPCSSECGTGTRKRFRKCVSHDPSQCTESLEHTSPCSNKPCGVWSKWGRWGKCRGRQGRMFRRRIRKCTPKGAKCKGTRVFRSQCKELRKPC